MDDQPDVSNHNQVNDIPNFVSFSAELMAAIRAWETANPSPLFTDPWATKFAGSLATQFVIEREQKGDGLLDMLALRTRFFDDFLCSASVNIRQIIILAAGLDARAFRLDFPTGTQIYELDQPDVFAKKHEVLGQVQPRCQRCVIPVDLTQPWLNVLVEHGYQPSQPSVWLMEGLLMYLTATEVQTLLQTIWDATAPGSCCAADVLNPAALNSDDLAAAYWRSGFDDPEQIFTSIGWTVDMMQPHEFGAKFGRFLHEVPPRAVAGVPRGFWISATK